MRATVWKDKRARGPLSSAHPCCSFFTWGEWTVDGHSPCTSSCSFCVWLGYCDSVWVPFAVRSAAVECSQYRITIIYFSLVHNEFFSCFYWLEAELGQRNCLLWMLQNIFARFSQSRNGILATFKRILIICLLIFSVQEPFQLLSIPLFCSLVIEKPIVLNTALWI